MLDERRARRLAVIFVLCAAGSLAALVGAQPTSYVRAYADAKFRDLNPAMTEGAQVAPLWGDPAKGPSAVLFKTKRGVTPLHTHSSDYHLAVIEGVMKHWIGGESEAAAPELGPGSYWYIRGSQPHADSCLSDVCVAFIKWEGKRDAMLTP